MPDINWNIEVNGTLYALNAGNTQDGQFLPLELLINDHSVLSTLIDASYGEIGLSLVNKTINNLRIRLIPSQLPTNEINNSGNPTCMIDEHGVISFCLAPAQPQISCDGAINWFAIAEVKGVNFDNPTIPATGVRVLVNGVEYPNEDIGFFESYDLPDNYPIPSGAVSGGGVRNVTGDYLRLDYQLLPEDQDQYSLLLFGDNPTIIELGANHWGVCVSPQTSPPLIENGWITFADMNWLVTVNNATNQNACKKLFNKFFGGVKEINCAKYTGTFFNLTIESNNAFGVYYQGVGNDLGQNPNFTPVLHDALNPEGYIFKPIDLSIPNIGQTVDKPFVVPLLTQSSRFTQVEIDNIRQIAKNNPVIIFGEWSSWQGYDNFILQDVMGYSSQELRYFSDEGNSSKGVPQILNPLGAALLDAGVSLIDFDCTGTYAGDLADDFAFAVSNISNLPTMLHVPYRDEFPPPAE